MKSLKFLKKWELLPVLLQQKNIKLTRGFSFDSGLIYPLIGINHLITRGIFQPLERAIAGLVDSDKGGAAFLTASVAMENPDQVF